MITLSKEEFEELDEELDQNQKTILEYLAKVHREEPKNPWVDIATIGAQLGGPLGSAEASGVLWDLETTSELVSSKRVRKNRRRVNMYTISQDGLNYIEFCKKQSRPYQKRYIKAFWFAVILLILLGVGLAIRYNNLFYVLIISVAGSLIVFVFQVLYRHFKRE